MTYFRYNQLSLQVDYHWSFVITINKLTAVIMWHINLKDLILPLPSLLDLILYPTDPSNKICFNLLSENASTSPKILLLVLHCDEKDFYNSQVFNKHHMLLRNNIFKKFFMFSRLLWHWIRAKYRKTNKQTNEKINCMVVCAIQK